MCLCCLTYYAVMGSPKLCLCWHGVTVAADASGCCTLDWLCLGRGQPTAPLQIFNCHIQDYMRFVIASKNLSLRTISPITATLSFD